MSNPVEQTREGGEEEEDPKPSDVNPNDHGDQSQEWEIMARAWLCSFPEAKAGSMEEVEAWIDSNHASLPGNLKSMPRSDLCQRLISIQNLMRLSTQGKEDIHKQQDEGDQGDLPHARFQRTDQWIPVYSWLESLQQDEVVKSKEISDWLTENPTIRDQLCSRHSRYHLMHYIKKCHLKILKRKEKKKGSQLPDKSPLKVHKDVFMKPALPPRDSFSDLPKDSDIYLTKRKEAFRKYEILVELEKLLASKFSKSQGVNN
ncbi:uncharacterized protein LOC101216205 [Cucumis sativus]|uniref:Channel forming colicins domain-containing protein n=1 Tax=Cucumis sativus TaxID=3659 RepID=A0A0A0LUD5_CUCSA|nr:uncharacterized protein LOC101216205 [Cucumis sativus]KGN64407.1 hypothetical protein Csa_013106 [Cucumis sativus]